jgi:predicted DNA-binding transcriptional regulator AlpA
MPDEPQLIIRGYEELAKYTGLGPSQTKELIAAGEFPKPKRLSERRRVWLARDIAEWQAKRLAAQPELEREETERRVEREARRGPPRRANSNTP